MIACPMEKSPTPETVARLMAAFRQGDKTAADQLIELLYPELRRLAASKMRGERAGHTWQPTLLVNELYLTVVKIKALGGDSGGDEQEKAAFLGLAGHLMKRLLIDHSRPLYRRAQRVELLEGTSVVPSAECLHTVEAVLSRLAAIDPKFRTVVEMRVFEGSTGDEIAQALSCSPRTVASYWIFAKRWLEKELAEPIDHDRTAVAGGVGDLPNRPRSARG
jgi:RNA polymerase sigma factor (TIGR02999 family)